MPRPQFSIRTLLWLTLVVAAFLGGIGFERERARRAIPPAYGSGGLYELESSQSGEAWRRAEAERLARENMQAKEIPAGD